MSELPSATIERASAAANRARLLGSMNRLLLLGSLYFAQGLPYGFFRYTVPALLRQQGVSLDKLGLTVLLALPWALKFLWAPAVDRYSSQRLGRRRSWILPMQAASLVILVALALVVDLTQLGPLMVGVFLLNLFAATQDVATDAFAVDILPLSERGLANGLQVAGYRLGMIVGGGLLVAYYDELGLHGIFWALAAFTLVSSIPVWLHRERVRVPDSIAIPPATPEAPPVTPARAGVHFLRRTGAWRIILLLFLYKAGTNLSTGMMSAFLVDVGLSIPDIGQVLGTVGSVAGLAGALTGGALVTPLGRRRALLLFGVCQAASVAGYLWLTDGQPARLDFIVACAAEHFASGLGTAALFTAMMDWSRRDHAGTDYTVQASTVVIATLIVSFASGLIAHSFGYAVTFAVAAALCVIGTAATLVLFPKNGLPDQADGSP
jgi:MFS transporter, PAT family, beta-lactamase induction signal transducer AmpG